MARRLSQRCGAEKVQRWTDSNAAASGDTSSPLGLAAFFVGSKGKCRAFFNDETNTPKDDDMTSSDANSKVRRALTRRRFLKATAGTAALLVALKTQFPFGTHVAHAPG